MNRSQDPQTIGDRIEIAHAVTASPLKARNLAYLEAGFGNPHVDQRLDFKAIAPEHDVPVNSVSVSPVEIDHGEALATKGIVPIAEIGVLRSIDDIDDPVQ